VIHDRGKYVGGPMDLKDYVEFLSSDDIRLKGTRVGIEIVLDDYRNNNAIRPFVWLISGGDAGIIKMSETRM
jgi:hypothetical protein